MSVRAVYMRRAPPSFEEPSPRRRGSPGIPMVWERLRWDTATPGWRAPVSSKPWVISTASPTMHALVSGRTGRRRLPGGTVPARCAAVGRRRKAPHVYGGTTRPGRPRHTRAAHGNGAAAAWRRGLRGGLGRGADAHARRGAGRSARGRRRLEPSTTRSRGLVSKTCRGGFRSAPATTGGGVARLQQACRVRRRTPFGGRPGASCRSRCTAAADRQPSATATRGYL